MKTQAIILFFCVASSCAMEATEIRNPQSEESAEVSTARYNPNVILHQMRENYSKWLSESQNENRKLWFRPRNEDGKGENIGRRHFTEINDRLKKNEIHRLYLHKIRTTTEAPSTSVGNTPWRSPELTETEKNSMKQRLIHG
ncbi:hypothetical protein Bhyg_03741 [Pseudolycoriella hygida]|uniref:Uncharacterized protein n=1 Tax=Pseudolycoriella hygida TaxID=35572 RepID=A0A9Q0NFB2_9DIPT|nr:hypothetical protein Bhyg_03741 [Pseudolycoriella hygida]